MNYNHADPALSGSARLIPVIILLAASGGAASGSNAILPFGETSTGPTGAYLHSREVEDVSFFSDMTDNKIAMMLDQIREIGVREEGVDSSFIEPHPNACLVISGFISDIDSFPGLTTGSVRPDGHGGIEITWEGDDRAVILTVRAKSQTGETQSYIYVEDGDDYDTQPVTKEALESRLKWVQEVH